MDALKEFIKPELMILIPVLYILGSVLKNTNFIADKFIPLTLGIVSIVLATLHSIATTAIGDVNTFFMALFVGITQGILCAGASVYVNQVVVVQPKK